MPDLRGWIVFIHVAAVLVFVLTHGVSVGVAFKISGTRDRGTLLALLEMSEKALLILIGAFVTLLVAGIVAGFMGDYWGRGWLWLSIVLFAIVFFAMTPMAGKPMRTMRELLAKGEGPEHEAALTAALAAWRPMPAAAIGVVGMLAILWLMMFKPF